MIRTDFTQRDLLIAAFRRKVYDRLQFVPFLHQAEWQLAAEGWTLLPHRPTQGQPAIRVRLPDETLTLRAIEPRVCQAKIVSDLAAYKAGKSYGLGNWLAGFAAVPGKVQLIGLEYNTSEPEFNYLLDALLSESGMCMRYAKLHNDPRGGRMLLKLLTGSSFEVKSWNNKETLKGKKVLCYAYCEAYQLPGLECYTSISQNLRQEQGWAIFATTPDRPWVTVFHKYGHGKDPVYHCVCGVDARVNPFTYDQRARDRDDPDKGGLMTKEKYAISWCGQMGKYVGSVYNYVQGQRVFSPLTHPAMFPSVLLSPDAHGSGSLPPR